MKLWRIARAKHQRLDGEGARLNGGRWNSEGYAVIYAASSAPLAVLELLVHVEVEDLPTDLVLSEIAVPDDVGITEVRLNQLPGDWNSMPDHPDCVRLGDEWVASSGTLLLRVPSAVMPRETNMLINPEHAEMERVKVAAQEPFTFDPRLIGSGPGSTGYRS
ncbi:MAG TPA: RES family NAD+ phosphorylase [Longimicrobiales bacterium]|nr:RES family NAD+ phosphorylase [Longimicrobiales bacterium]